MIETRLDLTKLAWKEFANNTHFPLFARFIRDKEKSFYGSIRTWAVAEKKRNLRFSIFAFNYEACSFVLHKASEGPCTEKHF
jgi:hypothetical protein